MSIQSNVGRLMLDIRDVCTQRVSQTLVTSNQTKNLNLSEDQLRDVIQTLSTDLRQVFDNGLDVVMNEFKRQEEAEKKKKAKAKAKK